MARDDDALVQTPPGGPTLNWARWYQPEWDEAPAAYVDAGVVGWGRSRRLLRADDLRLRLRAYLGVQHSDPSQWGLPGEPRAVFFLSVRLGGRTLYLRTYPTVPAALEALRETHAQLAARIQPI